MYYAKSAFNAREKILKKNNIVREVLPFNFIVIYYVFIKIKVVLHKVLFNFCFYIILFQFFLKYPNPFVALQDYNNTILITDGYPSYLKVANDFESKNIIIKNSENF
ncbi:hypothetical protein H312_00168 [Anncaliia algerae PRA339]|uniref:ISXO2-like transposase domain-containing protein n=1 Tax=Anncaliia algerae PRA339 TaxID=1288291 RepID=A0A059F5N5_9MICR|nr:hypothetical protein H312_00168 [Anncaliia algerae PRA339]